MVTTTTTTTKEQLLRSYVLITDGPDGIVGGDFVVVGWKAT